VWAYLSAGDAFRAGFAVGLVNGWPLQHSLQFAAAAGALAVSRKGALPSLPTLREVVVHLQEHADLVDPELVKQLGK
jgi:ribokinase